MGANQPPRRVLLKVSGNALSGTGAAPFDAASVAFLAAELAHAYRVCPQIAVVVGGGNVMRGGAFCPEGIGRIRADYAGMLATVINTLVLRGALEALSIPVSHYAAFAIPRVAQAFEPVRCIQDLEQGKLVLLGGGTGNPLFTTDTGAALRAVEIGADVLLKATRVDGVYSADPEQQPDAELFKAMSYEAVLEQKLRVMDITAVSFCSENDLPVRVFNYALQGNIQRAVQGQNVGTLIGSVDDAD